MRYPNAAEVERVYTALDKPMSVGDISRIAEVPRGRTVTALRTLRWQSRVSCRRCGGRMVYARRPREGRRL